MKNLRLLFFSLALCTACVVLADDVNIPTSAENPFDLTKGTFSSSGMNVNNSGEIDNVRNGNTATYTLNNLADADNYYFSFKAGTQRDDASLNIKITKQDGTLVSEKDIPLTNNGTWTTTASYGMKTGQMKRGKYTLVITFISTDNNYVARMSNLAFQKALQLQPGDEVPLVNPDFSDGNNGWIIQGTNLRISNEFYGNYFAMTDITNTGSISQSVNNLPDGLYLLQVNAFDHVLSNNDIAYEQWRQADSVRTFLFMNGEQALMKTAFDDRLTVANIYRWYQGKNGNYLYAGDGAFSPSSAGQEAEALAMTKGFYNNCLVAAVTDGVLTFGWRKTDRDRYTWIIYDNFRLSYLSTVTSLQAYANELKNKPMSSKAKSQLQSSVGRRLFNAVAQAETSSRLWADIDALRKVIEQQLAQKRARQPQATAAAFAALDEDFSGYTDNEAFNYLYRLQELRERLDYTFFDINVETMGTLGDLILQQTENFADVKSLRVSGQLNDDDLTTLRSRLTELVELDLSATPVPELHDDGLSHHSYLTWLTLPAKLKTIGRSCFYEDWNLRTVTFPSTLETIKPYAFYRCYNIGHSVVPQGVTMLGDNAYKESGLLTVELPSTLQTIEENTFRDCRQLYSVKLNEGLTRIGNTGFSGCIHLPSVKMPSTLKTIKEWAFENCRSLADVELNEGLTRIEGSAFNRNDSLKSITLPTTLVELIGTPFANCANLTSIVCKAVAPPLLNGSVPVSQSTPTVRVPAISDNVYKQTAKWDELPIVADATLPLPKDVYIIGQYNLSWPTDISANYKPNVYITNSSTYDNNRIFGHVTVGSGAQLNASQLDLAWNQKMVYDYVTRGWFGSFINNGSARADNITVEVPMQKDFWYFISFPFDVRVGDIQNTDGDQVPFVVRYYDGFKRANRQPNDTWVNLGADDVMQAGKGYIFRSTNSAERYTNTFRFSALQNASKTRFFRDEDVEVELLEYMSEYDFDRSWNLIGNPYPSFYDIRALQTTAPITVYEWNQGWWGSWLKYIAYSPQDDNYILNPGQAFFMQRPLEGGTIVFRKDGRQHNTNPRPWEYYNSSRAKAPGHLRQVYNLLLVTSDADALHTSETLDRARFVINESASLAYEPACDAAKFTSMDAASPELYILEGSQQLAIDERPQADGLVRVGLKSPTAATYTLTLCLPNGSVTEDVYLIDRLTGTETQLAPLSGETEGASYTFQTEAGTFDSRFVIRIGAATGIHSVATESQQSEQLFDLQGRHVSQPAKGLYVKDGKKVIVK